MSQNHYAEIKRVEGPFEVQIQGTTLARAEYAMELQEYHPSYEFAPVYYLPQASVDFSKLESNENHTTCPIKGNASYWNLLSSASPVGEVENIAWSYPDPLESASDLKDTVAFDLSKKVSLLRDGQPVTRWGIKKK